MAGNPVRRAWLTQPGGLATRLSGLRADAGLSVSALARQLGWERTKVSRIGSGVIAPTADEIGAWCQTPAYAAAVPTTFSNRPEPTSALPTPNTEEA